MANFAVRLLRCLWEAVEGVTRTGAYVELYHGTSTTRARKIQTDGFKIRAVRQQTMGGDPESSRNYLWFAKQRGGAISYAQMHSQPALIVVRIPVKDFDRLVADRHVDSGPVSVWINTNLPASYVHEVVTHV